MPLTAVVVGGSSGAGRLIAGGLVAAGCDVLITGGDYVELDAAAAELGSRARSVVLDIANPRSVSGVVATLPERINVLVISTEAPRPARSHGDDLARIRDSWLTAYESRVLGPVLMTSALSPRLAVGGRVILLGAPTGRTSADTIQAAEAGLVSYAGTLARGLGPRGITVNVVTHGRDSDLTATVDFLISESAGDITGQVLRVGGFSRV